MERKVRAKEPSRRPPKWKKERKEKRKPLNKNNTCRKRGDGARETREREERKKVTGVASEAKWG